MLALTKVRRQQGLSNRTRNFYLAYARQFGRWCLRSGRLRSNPFDVEGLDRLPVDADLRHQRRNPTEDEVSRLMTYLHSPRARVRRGMDGPCRALGYRVCMATGLRAGELGSLSRGNFDLDRGVLLVTGAYSKNRRRDAIPLPPWLAAELREWFAEIGGEGRRRAEIGGLLWNFPTHNPGSLLKADLAACGVPWSVPSPEGPLYLDFHALRVWYISWVAAQPGVSPKVLQTLARHSSPSLSLQIYAKVRQEDVRRLVDGMPEPGKPL